jgi:hypothetical protein
MCLDGGERPPRSLFTVHMILAHRVGAQSFDWKLTTIINMDNQTILKVNLEDIPDNKKALFEKATDEFREK